MNQPTDDVAARTMLRLRPDLHWSVVPGALADRWRVKDPVSLEYHEFGADERFLLEQFDGRRTIEEIRRLYEEQFRPQTIRVERLQEFATRAHARGLLLAEGRRQGIHLAERARRSRRQANVARLFSLLFLRLPGFDPNRLLDALEPVTRWFWRPATFVVILLAALLSGGILIGRAGEFAARLPSSQEYLQAGNLTLLLAAFVAMKAVHELAHGLACRYAGARCHEMGVILIALIPCLYCDVTDLWMVANRWKRMLVAAAGMYAELAIAVVCSFLWMMTSDGVASAILLNLMIAGAVSTLVFNADPLLKLDGYYILSDLLDIGNLHDRSRRALLSPLAQWFRKRPSTSPRDAFDWGLALYAAASLAYRVVVIVVIAWAAYTALAALELQPVGDVLIGLTLVGLILTPAYRAAAIVRSPLLRRTLHWGRVAMGGAAAMVIIVAVLMAPWQRTITAAAVFEMQDARPVAAAAPGRLAYAAAEGTQVAEGDIIARLRSPELERRRLQLSGEVKQLESSLESLRRQTAVTPALLSEIPTAEASVQRAMDDLAQLTEEIHRLRIVAPCDGVVVGATRPAAKRTASDPLPSWQGRLIDPENLGCWVDEGDLVCLVAPNPEAMQATLLIDQADTLGVRPGLPTRVLAYQSPDAVVRSPVSEVAKAEFEQLSEALRRHPDLLARQDTQGNRRTLRPVLLARVDLPLSALVVGHASHGRCKIEAASEPIGMAVWRWLAQTFPMAL